MRLQLYKLQAKDLEAREFKKQGLKEGWEEFEELSHFQRFFDMLEIIRTELISRHYDNPLASHFRIGKTQELIARKYYWSTLC